jgi:hypothetical protein
LPASGDLAALAISSSWGFTPRLEPTMASFGSLISGFCGVGSETVLATGCLASGMRARLITGSRRFLDLPPSASVSMRFDSPGTDFDFEGIIRILPLPTGAM